MGNLISVAFLFWLTEEVFQSKVENEADQNKMYAYGLLAILQILQAALLYWMIDEPETMNESEARH